jgi:hypothetical protein
MPSLADDRTPAWQLTARVYDDLAHVIAGFDLALCQVAYDGNAIWMTPLAAYCIANRVLVVTPFTMSNTCEMRVLKYIQRYGVDLYVPGLTAAEYADAVPTQATRGISGIKWILRFMRVPEGKPLRKAWTAFVRQVRKDRQCMLRTLEQVGIEMTGRHRARVDIMYAQPYNPDVMWELCTSMMDRLGQLVEQSEKELDALDVALLGITNVGVDAMMREMHFDDLSNTEQRKLLLASSCLTKHQRLRVSRGQGNSVDLNTLDMIKLLSYIVVNPGEQSFTHAQRHPGDNANSSMCIWDASLPTPLQL